MRTVSVRFCYGVDFSRLGLLGSLKDASVFEEIGFILGASSVFYGWEAYVGTFKLSLHLSYIVLRVLILSTMVRIRNVGEIWYLLYESVLNEDCGGRLAHNHPKGLALYLVFFPLGWGHKSA